MPDKFLSSNQEPFGGGSLQTNASDSTYYALLAARTKTFSKYGVAEIDKYLEKAEIMGRLGKNFLIKTLQLNKIFINYLIISVLLF